MKVFKLTMNGAYIIRKPNKGMPLVISVLSKTLNALPYIIFKNYYYYWSFDYYIAVFIKLETIPTTKNDYFCMIYVSVNVRFSSIKT